MDLSVVVATTDAGRSIDACLDRLELACRGLRVEILVVDASADDTPERVARSRVPVTLVRCPPGTLTPVLWATGLARAAGLQVAFTTGHCLVAPGWAAALTGALQSGAAGAGGPLVRADGISALDRAVYYLRYSAFMPHTLGSGPTRGEIAGDNAMYARGWLDRHAGAMTQGFWEIDVHRLIRADGGWLAAVPSAVAEFGRSFPLRTILRHRLAHGRQFGAGRVRGGTRRAWQIVVASPLVPGVLAVRALRRVAPVPGERWPFLTALPWFVVLAAAWAAGEALGALAERRRGPS